MSCSLSSFYKKLGPNFTNFNSEVAAIKRALQQRMYRLNTFKKAVRLESCYPSNCEKSRRPKWRNQGNLTNLMIIQLYALKKLIVLPWITAHCNISGNEKALKKAQHLDLVLKYLTITSIHIWIIPQNLPYESIKRLIKSKFK